MPKVLFICKQRQTEYGVSYGLINSCKFLCNALQSIGVDAKVVSVVDNNCIDREVHKYKPTHVFIEALWVVPEKFNVLLPLYPDIQWYVRLHSNTPFLANEGIAMEWINGYENIRLKYGNLQLSPNSHRLAHDLWLSRKIPTVYAPNIYFPDKIQGRQYTELSIDHSPGVLNVACFGAIRPMKNHLMQAIAAMAFANQLGKTLHFHINGRFEQKGDQLHRNMVHLFEGTKHKLVKHPWVNHPEFVELIKHMDLGMQVSFSETFNIVAADMVSANIPIVTSNEIEWMSGLFKVKTTDIDDIIFGLYIAYYGDKIGLQRLNKMGLKKYNINAIDAWKKLLDI